MGTSGRHISLENKKWKQTANQILKEIRRRLVTMRTRPGTGSGLWRWSGPAGGRRSDVLRRDDGG